MSPTSFTSSPQPPANCSLPLEPPHTTWNTLHLVWRGLQKRWLLVGRLPTEGTQWLRPLPQPRVICHLVDPEPTADLELGIYSQKTSPGPQPGSL